jgi:hypothetical protein
MMKFTKMLVPLACAMLLLVENGPVRHAYAQNAEEADQNAEAWRAGAGGSSADESGLEDKRPPIHIEGCWTGTIDDMAEGEGSIIVVFSRSAPTRLKEKTSVFDLHWNSGFYAYGHLKGSVDSTGIILSGHVGGGYPVSRCPISGSGTGDDSNITGELKFGGECAKEFKSGSFSITHFIGFCQFVGPK